MPAALRLALLSAAFAGAAAARPVTIEDTSRFGTPDPVYESFGHGVAIDGAYAIATAVHSVPDPGGDPTATQVFITAFLFQHNASGWRPVRRLLQYLDKPEFPIPDAVAMRGGIAAVQTVNTDIWQLTPTGWVRQPASLTREAPGSHLAIEGGRVINGDGFGPWNANIFEPDASGTWHTTAHLLGKVRAAGNDDEFRGGPVDISGDWAAVQQVDGEDDPVPEAFIYHNDGGTTGWVPMPYGSARRPDGITQFGPALAMNWPDVFVAGDDRNGTFVFREILAMGFHLATRVQALDSFMGSGPALAFAHDGDLLLQHAFSHDRGVSVVNVFRRRDDASYEHVAVLAARHGESLGSSIAISGRRVLVGGNFNGLVYSFELPASMAAPAAIQDTFARGDGTGWTPSAGSAFSTAPRGITRVYRQTNTALEAVAVLDASDFTSESIEADLRPIQIATAGSGAGLLTRFQNPQNFFEAILRNTGRVELRRMSGGTLRVLGSAAFTVAPNHNYRVRMESIGTLHRVFVDGQLRLDVDSAGPTHGRAALLTDHASAEFDNVMVSPTLFTTLYANDFEDRTGPWSFSGLGFWNLRTLGSVVLSQSSIAGDARASIGVPTDDQIVRVRARLDTFATLTGTQERWFGVMARHVDDANYYYLSLRSSNTVALRKVVNGNVTPLASAAFPVTAGHWYQLRLDAIGGQLRAYVDGNLLLEASDASLPVGDSGPVMFKAATDYDDFIAYQP